MKKSKIFTFSGIILLLIFIAFTVCVKFVEVKSIGPLGSQIGFATLNESVNNLIGNAEWAFLLSEILGYFALVLVAFFGILGIIQLFQRKSILNIDKDILILGGLYIITMIFYIAFEVIVVNYRPILEDGQLAVSYPSSHTMLAIVSYSSAIVEIMYRAKSKALKVILSLLCALLGCLVVICRVLAGVHWITDIIGGMLIASALVCLYLGAFNGWKNNIKV